MATTHKKAKNASIYFIGKSKKNSAKDIVSTISSSF
jgi:hypothetical protein